MRDQLSRERRDLPWELVDKQYTFEGEHGTQTLGDLSEGRSQLVIYHAMFNPMTEGPGISVFLKDGSQVYHTYSTYARGLDMLNVAYHYMDLAPKGRDEGDGGAGVWVRRRDEYQD